MGSVRVASQGASSLKRIFPTPVEEDQDEDEVDWELNMVGVAERELETVAVGGRDGGVVEAEEKRLKRGKEVEGEAEQQE